MKPQEQGVADPGPQRRRWRNPLDWSEAGQCLLLLALSVLVLLSLDAMLWVLQASALEEYFDRRYLRVLHWQNYAVFIIWLAVFWGVWRGRGTPHLGRFWPYVFVGSWTLHLTAVLYYLGTLTQPLWLMAVAGLLLGMLLLDRQVVNVGLAVGSAFVAASLVLQGLKILPYAPLFLKPPYAADNTLEPMWLAATTVVAMIIIFMVWVIADRVMAHWRQREKRFRDLSVLDGLTGLLNYRRFTEILHLEWQRARRMGRPLSLLICDIDYFKSINDRFGHHVGDLVLRELAEVFAGSVRQEVDQVARIGGEEFAILLPETDLATAERAAERILVRVRQIRAEAERQPVRVTVSIGVACLDASHEAPEDLFLAADELLYEAKDAGRDQMASRRRSREHTDALGIAPLIS